MPCTIGRSWVQSETNSCCSGSIEAASARISSTRGATQVAPARSAVSNGSADASDSASASLQASPIAHSVP